MNDSSQIITTNQARKDLGKKASNLTDVQIEDIIIQLDFIATLAAKDYRRNQIKKDSDYGQVQ